MEQKEFELKAKALRHKALTTALGFGMDADEAEDVAQDTIIKLWCMHSSIDDTVRIEALTATIARHQCIDLTRRRRTVPIDSRPITDRHSAAPDTILETAEDERWLEKRLSQLPSTEHAVLHLRQVERKTDAEIAALLGISTASVPTILSRARHKLLADIIRRRKQ